MHGSRWFLTGAGALAALAALAACSPDAPDPVAPSPSASVAAPSVAGRYILVSNSSFPSNLAAQVARLGGAVERVHDGAGIAVVTGISDASAAKLSAIRGVSDVQPDMIVSLDSSAVARSNLAAAPQDAITSGSNPAAAHFVGLQWYSYLIGADKAWKAGKLGSGHVTVAIIDTGIDYDAYDLNGLVDLSQSTSFVPGDDTLEARYFPGMPGRNSISDLNGHGTNVATQVSSQAVLFAGITSRTHLMAVKVFGGNGSGTASGVLNGVLWAADHGANVANLSLGGWLSKPGNGRVVALINRVFNYAGRKGVLVVVAAGNDGVNLDHIGSNEPTFCAAPQVVCVSAVGPATAGAPLASPASYTNYGRSAISVAAPGGDFTLDGQGSLVFASWVYSACSKTALLVDPAPPHAILGSAGCESGRYVTGAVGTSQAAPQVAGLAALIIAEQGITQPAQVKAAIEQSAVDLGQPGTDPYYGRGLISVSNALGL